ncbi:MAG TPA: hypothetical protein PKC55_05870 [Dysgonomonas sp.]|uniref:hypothetical protein n=1 Tax=unclassified Dysgonomonas TaxID=2630389 RepID=UPI0025C37519|nr:MULTISPECIES: hypothetical protein [unclassified Dysgonomonas]HML64340.1 hypothetical protein [Dysgonomonas sp.]
MTPAVKKVIDQITNEIAILAGDIFKDDKISRNPKVNKNTLREKAKDVNVSWRAAKGNIVIEAYFDNYITFLEKGRAPRKGKFPPLDELRDWALSRNIPSDNSTLFLIARAIWRDGHEGRPILATLEERIDSKFETEWYDQLFEATIDELNKYFN